MEHRRSVKGESSKWEFYPNLGSSAGVGSGDFHIYRGIRRRENERQKFVLEKADKEELDKAFVYVGFLFIGNAYQRLTSL